MHPNLRRLARLYRLLWMDDRVRMIEERLRVLEEQIGALGTRGSHLDCDLLALKMQAAHLLSHAEVSPALAEEYSRWKECNPVPEHPLVSVCVATYNRARLLLERCIPSVLGQTYDHLELIVVGDGCTDETEEAISRIHDPRLRFVNLEQRGTYPTDAMLRWMVAGTQPMNHAMSLARGHYVTHLDDDDEYATDRLEKLVAFARSHDPDLVWHPFWVERGPGDWVLNDARDLVLGHVTTSSAFYRSWFTRITWNIDAYRLREPGDWNRFRRIKYIAPVAMRYSEPLLRHYREHAQRH